MLLLPLLLSDRSAMYSPHSHSHLHSHTLCPSLPLCCACNTQNMVLHQGIVITTKRHSTINQAPQLQRQQQHRRHRKLRSRSHFKLRNVPLRQQPTHTLLWLLLRQPPPRPPSLGPLLQLDRPTPCPLLLRRDQLLTPPPPPPRRLRRLLLRVLLQVTGLLR
jgi:hypothetical protein